MLWLLQIQSAAAAVTGHVRLSRPDKTKGVATLKHWSDCDCCSDFVFITLYHVIMYKKSIL